MFPAKKKLWVIHRNLKNLKLRTKKRQHIKLRRDKAHAYNRALKTQYKNGDRLFNPPIEFSLIHNHEETVKFFNQMLRFIMDKENFGKSIYVDISQITLLTIDSLMYLLAIINNLNAKFAGHYSFRGNIPKDKRIRELLNKSGFYNYVKLISSLESLPSRNDDNVQIASGRDSNTVIARSMSDFVCRIANVDKRKCGFLYDTMIEMMSNTHKHAYPTNESVLSPHWYCFAEYDKENTITFSFIDTGEGIPSTVKKTLGEEIDVLNLVTDDASYVVSALNGEGRTATGLSYRGKGLPKIYKYCSCGKIKNMTIITNKAYVNINSNGTESYSISRPLQGTVFYWDIKLDELKGDLL